jgi:hypothetical protein
MFFEHVIATPDGADLNAIQYAIFYAFDSQHISTGTDLLQILLERFNHPSKHLVAERAPRAVPCFTMPCRWAIMRPLKSFSIAEERRRILV